MKLFESKRFGIDCYVIKYPVGAFMLPHIDPVEGKDHYRLNIVVKKAKWGGEVFVGGWPDQTGRIYYFRPDRRAHWMSKVTRGTRLVLSFGLAR